MTLRARVKSLEDRLESLAGPIDALIKEKTRLELELTEMRKTKNGSNIHQLETSGTPWSKSLELKTDSTMAIHGELN